MLRILLFKLCIRKCSLQSLLKCKPQSGMLERLVGIIYDDVIKLIYELIPMYTKDDVSLIAPHQELVIEWQELR